MKTKILGLLSALIIMLSPAFAGNMTKPETYPQQTCKADCKECCKKCEAGTCDKCGKGICDKSKADCKECCKKCEAGTCDKCGKGKPYQHYTAKAGELKLSGMFMRPTASVGSPTAAYIMIENTGKMADKLLSVSSDIATKTEIHNSTTDAKGMMSMTPVAFVEIPAGGKVMLAPKGTHIMMMNVSEVLTKGTHIPLLLEFEKSGKKMVSFPVRDTMGMMEQCKK